MKGGCLTAGLTAPGGFPLAFSAGSRVAGLEEVDSKRRLLTCSEAACPG